MSERESRRGDVGNGFSEKFPRPEAAAAKFYENWKTRQEIE